MLQEAIDAVKQFHISKNIDYRQSLLDKQLCPTSRHSLVVHQMKSASAAALHQFKEFLGSPEKILDLRLLRIHLILEEVAELIDAIDHCNEIETLDGMADALYVIFGAAVALDLPLSSAFAEVHASNMTKAPRSKNPDDARLYDKGEDYRPPDIARVLIEYRKRLADMELYNDANSRETWDVQVAKSPNLQQMNTIIDARIPDTIFCERCMTMPTQFRGGWYSEDNGQWVTCQACLDTRAKNRSTNA